MKNEIKLAVIIIAVFGVLFIPVESSVTIDKDDINSNRPFAGVINNDVVGTKLCCMYWLDRDAQPDVVTYNIIKPVLLQYLGYVYSVERLN